MDTAKSTLATIATIATLFTTNRAEEEEEEEAAEEKESIPITEELKIILRLGESIVKYASMPKSCHECKDLASLTSTLIQHLRSVLRLVASAHSIYERPIRQVCSDVTGKLERALTLVKKCQNKSTNIISYIFHVTPADFDKLKSLIDSSVADIKWILSVFHSDFDLQPSLLPIADNQPFLPWVWCYIAYIHSGSLLYRNDAVKGLSELCLSNARNKEMIVEEKGIPPLINLLKENGDPDAQICSVVALYDLADEEKRVRLIAKEPGVSIIVHGLNESPSRRVQMEFVRLVSRIVDLVADLKEEFGRKNVIRPLVNLLAAYVDLDEVRQSEVPNKGGNFRSIDYISKEIAKNVHRGNEEREDDMETPEDKLKLKVNCVNALWTLAKSSLQNSMQIVETKALLYLAKIMETEKGDLKMNCLYTVMELAVVAEDYPELRTTFKLNAQASKAVLDQLLMILNEENSKALLVPATKAIGGLARTFSVKETRIVELLVVVLGHRDPDVAKQAVNALTKFVELDNYNCVDHSKAVLEFDGLPKLMSLLKLRGYNKSHELQLLCYLSVNVGNNKAFDQARAKTVLEDAVHYFSGSSNLRDLFTKAIDSLALYQEGASLHNQVYNLMVEC